MKPEDIPAELKEILDRRADKTHSGGGQVMSDLAEILTKYEEILVARDGNISYHVYFTRPEAGSPIPWGTTMMKEEVFCWFESIRKIFPAVTPRVRRETTIRKIEDLDLGQI